MGNPYVNSEVKDHLATEEVKSAFERYVRTMRDRGAAPLGSGEEPREEIIEDDGDFWEITDDKLIRHHFQPRLELFSPRDAVMTLPIDFTRIGDIRTTNIQFVDKPEERDTEVDQWRKGPYADHPDREWTGNTEFDLIPLDEDLALRKLQWEDGPKKVMTRGQRKRLDKDVQAIEAEDLAMWSTLRRQKLPMFRGWKALLEIFAGCAVLTSVFQAAGYQCCSPLDLNTQWDVFRAEDRLRAEHMLDQERPYLLTLAFPCGPWSPWQRPNCPETVNHKRRVWIPVFTWMKRLVRKQKSRGGITVLENPWPSEAWSTDEMQQLLDLGFLVLKIDMCRFNLCDQESGLLHRKSTCIATDSPGIAAALDGQTCTRDHEHQPLEGRNCYGSRCTQAGRYTVEFCSTILSGVQKDLQENLCCAFHSEDKLEEMEDQDSLETIDGINSPEDLGAATSGPHEVEQTVEHEETLELLDKEADPEAERLRKMEWRKLARAERVGVRRLHHMTSHATKSQMTRMLRYANADPHIIRAVKHFKCPSCDRIAPEKRPQVVKPPDAYVFNDTVGLDIFTIKDALDQPYHVLHVVCVGTGFHIGEVLGPASGVPGSNRCLQVFLRTWCNWAGFPNNILVDRGTHNRGIFMTELERRGCKFRLVALEAPYQLGKIERAGGVLKEMMKRVVVANTIIGEDEVQMCLVECLQTKNVQGTIDGFSPAQWVLGKTPKLPGWNSGVEDEENFDFVDQDRGAFRESAKLAWAHADSHRRVRAALLRQGGSKEERSSDQVTWWLFDVSRRQEDGSDQRECWHVKERTYGYSILGYQFWSLLPGYGEPMLKNISKVSFSTRAVFHENDHSWIQRRYVNHTVLETQDNSPMWI